MARVTVSPKFQVVIPQDIRQTVNLRAGQKLEVFVEEGQILLVPVRAMKDSRGMLRGIDTEVRREKEDRA